MPLAENVPTETVQLDRPRKIALTVGAMRRIKAETGENPAKALLDPEKVIDRIGSFVWALLVNEDRDVTPEDVEEMLHAGNLASVQASISALVQKTAEPGKGTARKRASPEK